MSFKFINSAIILLAALMFAACNAADTKVVNNAAPAATPGKIGTDGVRRVTTAELAALMQEGKAFVVDVRLQDAYDTGHIPGSILIPAGEIQNHLDKLPRDKMIVTYCA
ncbi:MAG TPA: rhodanese-like domain-containing protein [Pyrinomonadaceae bacterium]|nr:rhodanese-like domain-containing protein [Pyrinomonadaceae bacterium]